MPRRSILTARQTVRKWVNRFGRHFADCIKRDRPAAADKWHLDEVVVPINGVKQWLWRAVDANGDVLDILVQPRRNAKAAKRFRVLRLLQENPEMSQRELDAPRGFSKLAMPSGTICWTGPFSGAGGGGTDG